MKYDVVCFQCKYSFNLLEANWCTKHKLGIHSKICPHCTSCACGSEILWKNWAPIRKELMKYGTPKVFNLRQFLVDGLASSVMWCSIWGAIYLLVGIPLNIFVGLMLGIVVLNFTMGGCQGAFLNLWRKKLL